MKKVAIVQSNYIPWKGYFDMIAYVDEFIIYDDMQYTRRDWRNRNQIKTPQGLSWLTVPVKVKGKYEQKIKETEIDGKTWKADHLKSLEYNYKKAPFFNEVMDFMSPLYIEKEHIFLTDLNVDIMNNISSYLGVDTKISYSWDYVLGDGKTERLLDLCKQAKGDVYVSGPAAKGYFDESIAQDMKIGVEWFDYSSYPEYPQIWGDFVHGVTILDLLFNCGKDSKKFMKYI